MSYRIVNRSLYLDKHRISYIHINTIFINGCDNGTLIYDFINKSFRLYIGNSLNTKINPLSIDSCNDIHEKMEQIKNMLVNNAIDYDLYEYIEMLSTYIERKYDIVINNVYDYKDYGKARYNYYYSITNEGINIFNLDIKLTKKFRNMVNNNSVERSYIRRSIKTQIREIMAMDGSLIKSARK